MKLLPEISCTVFGQKKSICIKNDPSSVIGNHYFVVGQLVGLSVLKLNRGPKCIHSAVVRAIFDIEQPSELETVEEEMLNSIIDSTEKGNFDALLDANINPFGKSLKELIQLYYLSRVILSTIKQSKSGIASIYPGFCESTYEAMRMFLKTSNAKITLDQFLRLVTYEQLKGRERESNLYKDLKIMFLNLSCF